MYKYFRTIALYDCCAIRILDIVESTSEAVESPVKFSSDAHILASSLVASGVRETVKWRIYHLMTKKTRYVSALLPEIIFHNVTLI